ncbi:MAG: glycoside hydrolase family 2 TIM barrel-domain containing protein, partial [Ginsengibacter sp.]
MTKSFLYTLASIFLLLNAEAQHKNLFNHNWQFVKGIDTVYSDDLLLKNSEVKWEKISLPHTANIEPIEKTNQQWQGICFYRKFFSIPASYKGKHIAIRFDAAMQEADVYLNGKHIYNHKGGYLPFYIDISGAVKLGIENNLVVKLDNRDDQHIPPGKPLKDLDFNYYSGIYRNTWLIVKDKLFITDPVAANTKAGGGVFVHYENISANSASLVVQTQVKNDSYRNKNAQIRIVLKDISGKIVAQSLSKNEMIEKDNSQEFAQAVSIPNPILWSPENPYLYKLTVTLLQNGKVIDKEELKTGIKAVRFEAGTFYLNEKKIKIRGTNRHQEYPYIGNAASDNAQYRDAWKIKQAGFNFVRSSHYPQSVAYLNACDELGIMVMDAIPGWQFAGDELFQQRSLQDAKDMIRRDRNHASIILWETSLNESAMKKDYMEKAHQVVHEELPFKNIYSAGWIDNVYDVFLPARQHGKAPDYWRKYSKNKPFIIAEYGDWEYYAQNAGFNQTAYQDLKK